ncbi:MAG: holo-ACP synthase [Gammaproteobacteria bacterium]|nr:holo-ACP synthase [Gammaproteobacteria bacterium]
MIVGIGTDIVCVSRMEKNLAKYGQRFAERILTSNEFTEFLQHRRPASFLAKRFAAKEAVAKAMGCGFRDGLQLTHIGVGHDDFGKPMLEYSDRAVDLCEHLNISKSHLSISDEDEYAVAFVTLEASD